MTYVIGLTGGIGSGKTTVARLFEKLGVPIIDADQIAHALTQKDNPIYQRIVDHFGGGILKEDLSLDRPKLREIIFENPVEKKWLEDLLHPCIRRQIKQAVTAIRTPYCICVIPLLKKTPDYAFINRILVVESTLNTQLSRVKKRDNSNPHLIQKIIATQATADDRHAIADDILENNGDLETLEDKVATLHDHYRQLAP